MRKMSPGEISYFYIIRTYHTGKDNKKEKQEQLPAIKWASVYRALRPFLRPFGDSGEGRLDFYHRTLSKVVRKK